MASEHQPARAAQRATELSEDVIQALEDSGRAAIEAVKGFVTTLEEALPQVEGARKVEKQITDSALEMAEQLVQTQSEFLRKVVSSAGKSRSTQDEQ